MAESTIDELTKMFLRKRVSLFNQTPDNTWCHIGVGQIETCYEDKLLATFLVIVSEKDFVSLLLKSIILPGLGYRRDGRYIFWSENSTLYGLSFQEMCGCDDIWNTICQVLGKDPLSADNLPNIDIVKKEVKEEPLSEDNLLDIDMIKREVVEETLSASYLPDIGIVKKEVMEEPLSAGNIPDIGIVKKEDVKPLSVSNLPDIAIAKKEEVDETEDDVDPDLYFKEMLDIEQLTLSAYESEVLGQLIELVNRLVHPPVEDIIPYISPDDRQLLDLFNSPETTEGNGEWRQLLEVISYLLPENREHNRYTI